MLRFYFSLVEPDRPISGIRLSDKVVMRSHARGCGGTCPVWQDRTGGGEKDRESACTFHPAPGVALSAKAADRKEWTAAELELSGSLNNDQVAEKTGRQLRLVKAKRFDVELAKRGTGEPSSESTTASGRIPGCPNCLFQSSP